MTDRESQENLKYKKVKLAQDYRKKKSSRLPTLVSEMFSSYVRRIDDTAHPMAIPHPSARTVPMGTRGYGGATVDIGSLQYDMNIDTAGFHDHIRKRINEAFQEIPMDIAEEIGQEYRLMILYHEPHSAKASGDMMKKGVGWKLVRNPSRPSNVEFRIMVPYWVYQETGFDMSDWVGKAHLLPKAVKRKIWKWGVEKGVVQRLKEEDAIWESKRTHKRKEWWQTEEEVYMIYEDGLAVGFATEKGLRSVRNNPDPYDNIYTKHEDYEYDTKDLGAFTPQENRVLYRLLNIVVESNTGREDNARFFFHSAYENVVNDRERIMSLITRRLKEHRILSK